MSDPGREVGDALGGAADAVGGAIQGVVDMTKDVASSDLGKAALITGFGYMGAGEAGLLGDAGATEAAAGATTAAVTQGSVVETPLGSLTADAATNSALETAATATGAEQAVEKLSSAEQITEKASSIDQLTDKIGEKLSGNMGSNLLSDLALTGLGTAALVKTMQPEVVQQSTQSGQSTTPSIDFTANERRASADEISNVMAFQSTASQRARMTGASVLANNAGSATTGTKKLLGA